MEYTQEQMERAKKCSNEVTEVLKKHNCDIAARFIIQDNGQVDVQKSIIANSSIIKPINNG